MRRLFISDLHLNEESTALNDAFAKLLTRFQGVDEIYLLGDIFEAWVGDDDTSEWLRPINTALQTATAQGSKVFFTHGNRDFLVGQDWAAAQGVTLLSEQTVLTLENGSKWLLSHGDEYCTDDVDYQQFRTMSRTPAWQAAMLAKPITERKAIAAHMRNESKMANANKRDNIMDVNTSVIEDTFKQQSVDLILHGHTHRPDVHQHKNGIRVVLGDWGKSLWYVLQDDDGYALKEELI